jgi:RNA polymerase sigma-70 factor, ECF subfamily
MSDVGLTAFDAERPRLFGLAYRMLGGVQDAEDVLQDAYLRWTRAHVEARDPRGLLTTIVARLCIDRLTSAQARREAYIGPWLPEPVLTTPDNAADQTDMHESISLAFLALLERLTPVERVVFLLRQVFDYDYSEIAAFVDKSESACRQIFSRAQKHVRENRPRMAASREAHRALLEAFLGALADGDVSALTGLLHESVVQYGDGGGKAFAALKPIVGRESVLRLLTGLRKFVPEGGRFEIGEINGWDALIVRHPDGAVFSVTSIETDGARIYAVRNVINPEKLTLSSL